LPILRWQLEIANRQGIGLLHNELACHSRTYYDRGGMLGINSPAQGCHRTPFQIPLVQPHDPILRLSTDGGSPNWLRIFTGFWPIDFKIAHYQSSLAH
jgi:hypothetical protein